MDLELRRIMKARKSITKEAVKRETLRAKFNLSSVILLMVFLKTRKVTIHKLPNS